MDRLLGCRTHPRMGRCAIQAVLLVPGGTSGASVPMLSTRQGGVLGVLDSLGPHPPTLSRPRSRPWWGPWGLQVRGARPA